MLEEAKKRDHRKLGKELELFDIFEEGPGFPVLPAQRHGCYATSWIEFWRELHQKAGYVEVRTPQIMLSRTLWEHSRSLGSLQGQYVHHPHRRHGLLRSSR